MSATNTHPAQHRLFDFEPMRRYTELDADTPSEMLRDFVFWQQLDNPSGTAAKWRKFQQYLGVDLSL